MMVSLTIKVAACLTQTKGDPAVLFQVTGSIIRVSGYKITRRKGRNEDDN